MSDDQKIPPTPPVTKHEEATFPPKPEQGSAKTAAMIVAQRAAAGGPSRKPIKAADYAKLDDAKKWQVLVEVFHLNRRSLLSIPGVTAVDIGYKIEGGFFQNELALRAHVERKLPENSRDFKDRPFDYFPKREAPPKRRRYFPLKSGDEVPTDVIEGDYGPVQLAELPRPAMVLEKPQNPENVNRRRRLDPLVGGISIGSPQSPSGTLGALVWDNTDGSICILSNWHVLSGDPRVEAGTPCFQPGRIDHGRSSDVVAHLKRWSFDNQTDAAIAELTGNRHYCAGEILSLTQQITGDVAPHLGMLVQKYGRSTGFTWGFVDGLYFSSAIEYSNGVVQVFEDQIHIAPAKPGVRISEPGDSGSVWLAKTQSEGFGAVGLHFAGDLPHSAFGEYALANPMSIVMENLNFSFRPRFLELRDEDVLSPPPLPVQIEPGNGAEPVGIAVDGLTETGIQPDQVQVGAGGSRSRGRGRGRGRGR